MQKSNYEERIIAFIDILGFKDHIKNKDKQEKLLSILYEIRKNNTSLDSKVTEENPGQFSVRIIPDVYSYSDNIIISAPTTPPELSPPLYFGNVLFFITHIISTFQRFALFQGIALRGAISYGEVHVDGKNNIIIGNPLVEVIEDEAKLANYPRVIISKTLLQYIAKMRNKNLYGLYNDPNFMLDKFRVDFDGIYYLDFLKLLTLIPTAANEVFTCFQKIREQIEININKNMDNLQVVSKCYWLANYFDLNCRIWESKNSEFSEIKKFNLLKNNYENCLQIKEQRSAKNKELI